MDDASLVTRWRGIIYLVALMLTIWYGLTSVLFGVILFYPIRKLILALNVNRQKIKAGRELTSEELANLKRKVTVLAAALSITFAFFYNKIIMLRFFQP